MAERGILVDHATLNRWVVKYSPDIAKAAQMRKQLLGGCLLGTLLRNTLPGER